MPVLKNQRYEEFEHSTPRDAYRGLPLQQFPWVLEEKTIATAEGELHWALRVECLNAIPSGFGVKLNLNLRASARLKSQALGRVAQSENSQQRVQALFGDSFVHLEEHIAEHIEATLEDMPKLAGTLRKKMVERLEAQWSPDRVQEHLRGHLRRATPGGFGQMADR